MRFKLFETLGVAMIALAMSGVYAAVGELKTISPEEREREWYTDLYNSTYVRFPNGKLYKHGLVTGKWLGPTLGRRFDKLVIWHCGFPVLLNTKTEKHVFMQARPVNFFDEGDKGPEFAAQCMTHQYPKHPWEVQMASR